MRNTTFSWTNKKTASFWLEKTPYLKQCINKIFFIMLKVKVHIVLPICVCDCMYVHLEILYPGHNA